MYQKTVTLDILQKFIVDNHIFEEFELHGMRGWLMDGVPVDKYLLLASACRADSEEAALKFVEHARTLCSDGDRTFRTLCSSVMLEIAWSFQESEASYYELFRDVYPRKHGGEIVKVKTDKRNIPDLWIKRDENLIPVEIKFDAFNKKALKQLQRYMQAYSCDEGIAVAKRLTVDLPLNISFISVGELKAYKEEAL